MYVLSIWHVKQISSERIFRKSDLRIVTPHLYPLLSCILEGILQKMIGYLVLRDILPMKLFRLDQPLLTTIFSKRFCEFGVCHTLKSTCSGDHDDNFVVKLVKLLVVRWNARKDYQKPKICCFEVIPKIATFICCSKIQYFCQTILAILNSCQRF